jgi:DHA2 family multidrug resistance protein
MSVQGEDRTERKAYNPWLIAITVTLATFMEVLDTSIANIALPHISGTLGASTEESAWVLTSYLVASAIVLPLSGWLTDVLGRKRFYMTCVALFTLSSLLCGLATSLPALIVFRIFQGIGGGGLQPSEQAILADTFKEKQRAMAFAVYGIAVIAAPALGPTIGGWITDSYSWHWIFFINVPIGVLSLFLTQRIVHDPPWMKGQKRISNDYIGVALIVIGIGLLQYVLDKGQEDDWFGSQRITACSIISAFSLLALVVYEWRHRHPIVDLQLFRIRNFSTSILFSFVLGSVVYGSTLLIPQFLQRVLGYTAERAGLALMPGGFTLMLLMPLAAWMGVRFDRRLVLAMGFVVTAFGLYHLTSLSLDVSFHQFQILRIIQLVGLPFIFVNITTMNYVGVPPQKNNQVSAMSSFARNLGGSFGVSLINTFMAQQMQIQRTNLTAHTNQANPFFHREWVITTRLFLARGFDSTTASRKAIAQLSAALDRQAVVKTYLNTFCLMAVIVLSLLPFILLFRKPSNAEERAVMESI